jgi:hypothetical protein
MKKLLVFGFLLLLSATQIFAQGTYYSDYYSNNPVKWPVRMTR